MEVIIATPYKIANFGAILQAWALRTVLERMGHHVQYLNCRYLWPGIFGWKKLLCSRSFAAYRSKCRINSFMRNVQSEIGAFPETRPYDSLKELLNNPPDADCFIAGSDQIFALINFEQRKRYMPILLGFGNSSKRRIAYGASFGTDTVANFQMNKEIQTCLTRFNAIGIRERSGVKLLKEWSGCDGEWTPDPTLLLKDKDYREAFKIGEKNSSHYIASYMLGWGDDSCYQEACNQVREQYFGCGAVVRSLNECDSLSAWLSELANAECLITNSYHGYCFSQIFGIPCKVLKFDGKDAWRNERTRDLQRVLKDFSLDELSRKGICYLERVLCEEG